jgi:hypothetical protein
MTKQERFEAFVAEREARGDWQAFASGDRSKLARRKICEACRFARSTLYQNPTIRGRIADLETTLRTRGLLQPEGEGGGMGARGIEPPAQREAEIETLERRLARMQVAMRDLKERIERHRLADDADPTAGAT